MTSTAGGLRSARWGSLIAAPFAFLGPRPPRAAASTCPSLRLPHDGQGGPPSGYLRRLRPPRVAHRCPNRHRGSAGPIARDRSTPVRPIVRRDRLDFAPTASPTMNEEVSDAVCHRSRPP